MDEPVSENSGPYVQIAAFCEAVLEEKTGVLSLVRVIDRITVSVPADAGQGNVPPQSNLTILIALKSGSARGSHTVSLRTEAPSGLREQGPSFNVLFEGDDRGVNLVLPVSLSLEAEGLHWFDVLLDDHLITRMPLRVIHQRIAFGYPAPA